MQTIFNQIPPLTNTHVHPKLLSTQWGQMRLLNQLRWHIKRGLNILKIKIQNKGLKSQETLYLSIKSTWNGLTISKESCKFLKEHILFKPENLALCDAT